MSGAAKRAYLMSSGVESGATFVIKNSIGSTVFGPAAMGANLGSWSRRIRTFMRLDFDSFVTAGTYTISVSGPIAASSPSFKIDTAANVYCDAAGKSSSTTRTSGMARISSAGVAHGGGAPERPEREGIRNSERK